MGYFTNGFDALRSTEVLEEVTDASGVVSEVAVEVPEYWVDMGMYIGSGTSMPGWWTLIATVMLLSVLIKGNMDEQNHYK